MLLSAPALSEKGVPLDHLLVWSVKSSELLGDLTG
jgi:hypothetical protein